MVNHGKPGSVPERGLSTRAFILRELRRDPGAPVSGEDLAKGLGISRVAVWKGVRSLVAAGYPVESGESGYRLPPVWKDDFLYPWEFGEREALFRYFSATGSTMDRARELAEQPASELSFPSGTVIAAEVQSAGRGRNGRNWASMPGGLFFTILEKPDLAVADYPLFSMAAQIGAAESAAALCGREVRLRWPNDVYVGGKKVAGVLTELSGQGDRLRWISCGVGINVNNRPAGADAVSCAEIAGRPLSRREGLGVFLDAFEKLGKPGDPKEIGRRWNSLAQGIGSPVRVIGADHGEGKEPGAAKLLDTGVFAGIDPQGRCVIRNERGEARYSPGAASLIYPEPVSPTSP
ncbi:MAG: biotin--[acetyl-CoA-carboxylase] ligase [Treponema sp.]|nr:biotin--[acetyl-CoA-carboxylase] ligase [Treponema sp.]